jgi:hypothetical protein
LPDRARAYLDVNCGHCHNPHGFAGNSGLYLDLEQTDMSAVGVGKRPVAAGRASGGLEFSIVPGDPDHSIIVHRMASTEPGVMMPQLGRSLVHAEGLALVRAYVAAMVAEAPMPAQSGGMGCSGTAFPKADCTKSGRPPVGIGSPREGSVAPHENPQDVARSVGPREARDPAGRGPGSPG